VAGFCEPDNNETLGSMKKKCSKSCHHITYCNALKKFLQQDVCYFCHFLLLLRDSIEVKIFVRDNLALHVDMALTHY
jgi:hypothetical protein